MIRYASVCSGVGGLGMGFDAPDFECVLQCEIDRQARSVLQRHYPNVPTEKDIHNVSLKPGSIDLLMGGIPCQDYSVAGRRAGLAGDKGALYWEFSRLARESRARLVIIENVPGLLSSDRGRSFATILLDLAKLGYRICWRILDAQYVGVAQRRRRLFIVGSLGDGRCAEILFEPESLCGDPPTRREAGEISATLAAPGAGTSRPAGQGNELEFLIPELAGSLGAFNAGTKNYEGSGALVPKIALTLLAKPNISDDFTQQTFIPQITHSLTAGGHDASEDGTGRGTPIVPVLASTLTSGAPAGSNHAGRRREDDVNLVAFGWNKSPSQTLRVDTLTTDALQAANSSHPAIASRWDVRRLTPRECERLMGWPDDHTRYGHDGKEMADGPRYRMCGNGVVGSVSRWLAERVKMAVLEPALV